MEIQINQIGSKTKVSAGEMLKAVGEFGRFQISLTFIFSVMLIPSTLQILIMYFAALRSDWKCTKNSTVCPFNSTFKTDNSFRCTIPRDQWEYTENQDFSIVTKFDICCDKEWLIHLTTSIFFIGWGFGAVVLGWVADNYGRKTVLFPSLCTCMFVGLISPFLPNITLFIITRFIVGFCSPGTGLQMFIIISELVGERYRPVAGNILWIFLTVAFCSLGLKAYLFQNWKWLFVACTAPYFGTLLFYRFIPESVRWLSLHGRHQDAMDVYRRISMWNKNDIDNYDIVSVKKDLKNHRSNPKDLFQNKNIAKKTLIQGLIWMVEGMVFYGLALASDDLGGSLYLNFFLVNIVEIPSNLLSIDFCRRFGRKKTAMYSLMLSGVACVVIAFIPNRGNLGVLRIALAMLGKLCVTMSFNSMYTWSVELHATDIRAEGMGFLQVTSRFGAASAPWIAKGLQALHKAMPFVIMGLLGMASAITALILPETKGKKIKETDMYDENGAEDEENLFVHMESCVD